jgi:ABC-type glycerol-3-phosphate transport system substrate-binding protein
MWWIGVSILIALVVVACAAPEAVQQTVEVQEVEKTIQETVVVEKEVEVPSKEITVRAWAADEFEEQAIHNMVDRFRELYPEITVHLIVVTPGGAP